MDAPRPTPRLRLFISTDIVNSTAFKQSSPGEDGVPHPWLKAINEFFSSIREELEGEYEKFVPEKGIDQEVIGDCPEFWKAAGDELILIQQVIHEDQPIVTLHLFLKALSRVRRNIRLAGKGLDLKVTAWLAGFPINNAEFVINKDGERGFPGDDDHNYNHYVQVERFYKDEDSGQILDFIGPQMDLGFRLASLATPRKMVASLDLVWLLTDSFLKGEPWRNLMNIETRMKFDGTHILKGVLSGAPYPVFWFDVQPDPELNSAEDRVSGLPEIAPPNIIEYCKKYSKHHEFTWLDKPFVCRDENEIENLPSSYQEKLASLRERLQRDHDKYEKEVEMLSSDKTDSDRKDLTDGERKKIIQLLKDLQIRKKDNDKGDDPEEPVPSD